MLEHELILAADFDDDRELVEVLDARVEVPAIHEMNLDREPIAAGKIQKDILNRGLSRCRCSGFSDLGHQE
jgi:hypothetical protein